MGSKHIATHRSLTVLQWRVASPNRYMQKSGNHLFPDLHLVSHCSLICTLCARVCVCVCGCDWCECCRYLNVVGGIRPSRCLVAVISASIHCCKHILMRVLVCACRLQVDQVVNWHEFPYSISCLHTAPSRCPTVSGHWITPGTDSVVQHTAGSTAAQHFYLLSLSSVEPDNDSTCIKLKLFFPPSILLIMYWLLSLVWRLTRIQGVLRCCVFLEEAPQSKQSNKSSLNGWSNQTLLLLLLLLHTITGVCLSVKSEEVKSDCFLHLDQFLLTLRLWTYVWADVIVSSAPEARLHSAGSGHTHLW